MGLRVLKVALSVSPEGVICAFGLAEAASDDRPIGEILIIEDSQEAYLADKGFTGVQWERRWSDLYGALVAATPKDDSKRAWAKTDRRWASGKHQIIEGVIDQLKDLFALERHRAKTLGALFWPAWRPRWRPTLAGSGSTISSGDRCATWPIFWSERLCITRLRASRG